MGMEIEFNWYIVIKDQNVTNASDHDSLDVREIKLNKEYEFIKKGHRIYPLDTPLPLLYNGNCLALACINRMEVKNGMTHIYVQPTLLFEEDDAVALYYQGSFNNYKREQQQINDGGKVDIRQVVNPSKRMRV